MSKLRAFFKRHVLLVGLAAVVVPLLAIIGLQYWSLRKLEKTSIVAGTVGMKNYLGGVSSEVKMFYKSNAEQALAVPAYSVEGDNLCDLKDHFPVCKVEGAKRLFIAAFAPDGEQQTLFFDTRDTSVRVADVPAAEARAVQFATTPMRLMAKEGMTAEQPMVWMEDHDPDNLILIKAINEDSTVVGANGIVLALRTASREMRLSQMKADFVSNVSHELRTPLASIRVFGEFMKLGRVTEQLKIREYGEHIETESRRLTQLINNILDFSKIESGRKTSDFA